MENVKQLIAEVLNEAAEVIETGRSLQRVKVGITLLGSEHGVQEVLNGALEAQKNCLRFKLLFLVRKKISRPA